MESTKVEIVPELHSPDFRTRYVINSHIVNMKKESDGTYYVHLQGSWEWIGLGRDTPNLGIGDRMRITLERIMPDALPSQPPV